MKGLNLIVLGLSLSSSWGNGHATTYRSLLEGCAKRGHRILFLERTKPWYAAHCDLRNPEFCQLDFYSDLDRLFTYRERIADADAVIVGSYVPEGATVGAFVQRHAGGVAAFYDIDTPVTLAQLRNGCCDYLSRELISGYDLYLSFTGGPTLDTLTKMFGSPAARPLYCSVDETIYRPMESALKYDLGYLGTYSPDRQPALDRLLIEPARRAPQLSFVVGGSQYPEGIDWPNNVTRIAHVPPDEHPTFYNGCRFALNVTRADMIAAGFSPSVRLFEAAACGTPIVSDMWPGIDTLLLPGSEIAIASKTSDILALLQSMTESARRDMAAAARRRVMSNHTGFQRAAELEKYIKQIPDSRTYAGVTSRRSA